MDTIYNSYEDFIFSKWKIDEVILSGGGAFNSVMVEKLAEKLKPIPLSISDKYSVPPDSKEAIAFAILANETIFYELCESSKSHRGAFGCAAW